MSYKDVCEKWMNSPVVDDSFKRELAAITDEDELKDRFGGNLSFGTAGLRGVMAAGTARMNIYVVRHTTQAFAQVVLEEGEAAAKAGVAVCCDSRLNSQEFAVQSACVMAANGINVRIFESLRPTPELSFAIRYYGCTAGINITASHNPMEYNGYKVYWSDGAQLPPKHADAVAAKMAEIDMFDDVKTMDYDEAVKKGLITVMGEETDEAFLKCCTDLAKIADPEALGDDSFKMVYTPFHGTGYRLVPEALKRMGAKHVYIVPEQAEPDGRFPTVKYPNPEYPEGFKLAIELADRVGADFIIGTDPDADRVGMMIRGRDGKFVTVTGNQAGALGLDYLIAGLKRTGALPEKPVALKSIVTTELIKAVANAQGVECFDTFTGFKFIAEKKDALENSGEGKVIFGAEESYGYMMGDFVRDKDAVTAALVFSQMAAWYSRQGILLTDALEELFKKYGYYGEKTVSLEMTGFGAQERMKAMMAGQRSDPPKEIGGVAVAQYRDYRDGTVKDAATGKCESMELKDSDVLSYVLEDGTVVIVRPSGTEPKVKVYILAKSGTPAGRDEHIAACEAWANALV